MSSARHDSVIAILENLPSELAEIKTEVQVCEKSLIASSRLRIRSFDFLIHCRSVLDYSAQEIATLCKTHPKDVYFPVAQPPKNADDFRRCMQGWFPRLEKNHPDIYKILDYWQYYNSNDWLPKLIDITNETKHVILSLQNRSNCEALIIEYPGHSSLQIGDRGLKQLEIKKKGGKLTFCGPDGKTLSVRGPQTIDISTTSLDDADSGLILRREQWTEHKFDVFPGQPVEVLLEVCAKHVCDIARQIWQTFGKPIPASIVTVCGVDGIPRVLDTAILDLDSQEVIIQNGEHLP